MVHKHSHRGHSPKLGKRSPDGGDEGVHVVYVTAPATFNGDIGGYVTGDNEAKTEAPNAGVGHAVQATKTADADEPEETGNEDTEDEDTDHASTKEQDTEPETQTVNEKPAKTQHTATDTNAAAATTNNEHAHHTTLATATADVTRGNTHASATNSDLNQLAAATSSSSGSSDSLSKTSEDSGSSDISSGAKAGVAIGAVLGVVLIAVLVFFLVRKKKQSKNMRDDEDEKVFGNLGPLPEPQSPPVPGARTPEEPPQLDVRPITQFAPFGTGNNNGPITTTAAAAAEGAFGTGAKRSSPQSPVSSHKDPFGDPVNPFENNRTEPASRSISPPEASGPGATHNGPAMKAAAAAVATGAIGGAAALKAKPSEKDLPAPPAQPLQDPAGPGPARPLTPDTASVASYNAFAASPVVAPAGSHGPAVGPTPGGPGPLNVHRVQMDFTPSMDDELSLRSGQLIRLAHEYDDGWALCVRLDRPQQGVAPRSCLSARPVKPRPRPPPGAPGSRGPPAMGMNGRPPPGPSSRFYPAPDGPPNSPGRSMSPAHPRFGGPPASPHQPMSPAQYPLAPRSAPGIRQVTPRSMSPGPYGAPGTPRAQRPVPYRSNSAGRDAAPAVADAGSPAPPVPQPSAAEAHNVF